MDPYGFIDQWPDWKDVPGFEGRYMVSDDGYVFSLRTGKLLKPNRKKTGYLEVTLAKNNRLTYRQLHRLIAEAFIPNPENKPQVNHKNGDKTDNRVCNLEWVTGSENQRHRYEVLGQRGGRSKPVVCIETGETYPSAKTAADVLKLQRTSITCCCRGTRNTAGNLHFKFLEEYNNE